MIVEDLTVTVKYRTAIQTLFLYFLILCLSVVLYSLLCSFTLVSFLLQAVPVHLCLSVVLYSLLSSFTLVSVLLLAVPVHLCLSVVFYSFFMFIYIRILFITSCSCTFVSKWIVFHVHLHSYPFLLITQSVF